MKRTIFFVFFVSFVVSNLSAQNWDINTLHRVNSWDNKFVRNYNKFISRSEPYVAIGVPVAMALTAWAKKDKDLLKDAVYVGTSVAGAFVVTYGMKYLVDRERPYDRYPDRVHPYSYESSPSFPSGHTAASFASVTALYLAGEKKLWKPALVLACLIAVSRLYLYVHYPTDVLGGMIFGILAGFAGYWIVKLLETKLSGRKNAGKQVRR